jgi:hypothetical protein
LQLVLLLVLLPLDLLQVLLPVLLPLDLLQVLLPALHLDCLAWQCLFCSQEH